MKISVLICTRNGEKTVVEAIAHLGRQIDIDPDDFEVIVVDNGSADDTVSLATKALDELPCPHALLNEPIEGKTKAFLRGVKAAKSPLIAVVDDDNFVCEEFLWRMVAMFDDVPEVGVIGCFNTVLATDLPNWFQSVAGPFGCAGPSLEGDIRELGACRRISSKGAVAGAGSAFRAAPLLSALKNGFVFLNDTYRNGKLSVTGEDTELCWLMQHFGYWIGSDTRIRLKHKIDPRRLTWPYARKLFRSIGGGVLAFEAYSLLELNPSSFSTRIRSTSWWVAGKRIRRLMLLFPAVFKARLAGRTYDRILMIWEMEIGALRRVCSEPLRFSRAMKTIVSAEWRLLPQVRQSVDRKVSSGTYPTQQGINL